MDELWWEVGKEVVRPILNRGGGGLDVVGVVYKAAFGGQESVVGHV